MTLTYGEIDARSNRLARRLRGLGVGPEVPVGVLLNSSPDMVVAILAVIKAGGAYMPLEPSYPPERLRSMLDDAGVPGVIAFDDLPPGFALERRWLLRLDPAGAVTDDGDAAPLANVVQPANLAYVIYTSGSTGRPKGVAVPHSAVVRLVQGRDYVRLGATDRVAQASNLGFDAATFEIWGALLNGGCLAGIRRDEILAPGRLAARLAELGITTLFLTTALFNQVAREAPRAFRPLRQVLFGGEAVDPAWVRQVLRRGAPKRLLHVYGPTETTTFAAWQHVVEVPAGAATVPLGRPLANGALHVLDTSGNLVPHGVAGELHIGGGGLARGYLGQPAASAERFVPDVWSGQPGQRLYRTGDQVRRRPGGEIEFLGRIDRQVKIRGFRIEPGDIEAALLGCATVREAAVVVREDEPTGRRLVAFVVAAAAADTGAAELREELKLRLPEYMVPGAFVLLPSLPLTASGKIDRQALQAAELAVDSDAAYAAPVTPTEEKLAEIWSGILGREGIGRHDDFFALGGHSLLATQVVLRVRQAFSIELPLYTLFENPQLSSFAEQVERTGSQAEPPPSGTLLQRVPRDGDLPLSYGQQRLWFLVQLEPESPVYNIPAVVRLAGRLDTGSLARSLDEIRHRHEALRTSFPAAGSGPVQRISEDAHFPLTRADLTPLPEERRDAEAIRRAEEAARQPFDLGTGPLIRGLLLRLREDDHVLVLTMSHLVSDGWSMGVLTRELGVLYEAFSQGLPVPLSELPIQYADFSHWQRRQLSGELLEEQLSFWRERLRGVPDLLELPSDRPRPRVQSFAGAAECFSWPPALSAALRRLSRGEDATLFMTLLAAFQVLLYRQSGQADFCVGAPIANRTLETEALIGFFVNTLAMRAALELRPTFRERLRQVREFALAAYDHQDVPFEMVVEALHPRRSPGYPPLVQVMFDVLNASASEVALTGLSIRVIDDTQLGTSKRDLSLTVADTGEALRGALVFSTDLFDAVTIRRLAAQLEVLVASIAAQPDVRIDQLELLSDAARHQLLIASNDTLSAPPAEAGAVHLLLERQADRTPALTAVAGAGGRLSFSELDTRANQLAHHLRQRGVGPESLVALYLERSEEMVAAILGVQKAGGAYLPLDPREPQKSLAFILGDARPRLLVTRQELRAALPAECPETVLLDAERPVIERQSTARPVNRTEPGHLLYVIYTSGSTGRPKGVMIAHHQMLNYVAGMRQRLHLPPGAGYAMVSTFAADLGSTMLYPALASGGCLHVVPERDAADPAALAGYFERHRIDVMKIVPSHLAALMTCAHPQAVLPRRCLVLGGEASRWELIERIQAFAPGCVVLNHYGPTETTVGVMVRQLEPGAGRRGPVPLGPPIANIEAYVLDRHLQPVPTGAPGQLHIGGAGLARGYLGHPELTAARFIPDPFGSMPGGRLYTTGDLARHLPDHTVEFLGRTDHQIKLRGFRIELGEIESRLAEHPGVRKAVVVVREQADHDRRLVAYVVAGLGDEPAPSASGLREFLRERLPEHMVPTAFIPLPELPLTSNGKVDRRVLEAPEAQRVDGRITVPPRDALESRLVLLWQDLLGVQPVGIHDNFFDLGGHSLLMVGMMARLEPLAGKVPPLAALLQHATVAELGSLLRQEQRGVESTVVRLQPRGARTPFFCVHPAGGKVLSYLELARRMAPDQPFYALQADDGDEQVSQGGVEQIAARYVDEILAAQPQGPYSLGGHSFGGVVAYEMARRLEEQGHTVALLVLLDSAPASPGEEPVPDHDPVLMANFALHLGLPVDEELLSSQELAGLATGEQLAEVLRRAKQAGLVPAGMRPDEARRLFELLRSHVEARLRYVPRPYAGRITLFRAHEQILAAADLDRTPSLAHAIRQTARKMADPKLGWGELAAHGVEVHELPGNHFSMLRPPHVAALAGELRSCLARARSEKARPDALH
ncbi:MAG: amino acid adenylation domain-containing protein [Acidobacteriota bacterium]|nr:amino acid adenylation domain-containing protein [Acidobacteriota bacterium]